MEKKSPNRSITIRSIPPTQFAMHTDMLAKLSSKISKLFYDWKPDDQYQEDAGG